MKRIFGLVVALALQASMFAGAAMAQEAAIDPNMLNGNWVAVPDADDGAKRAFVFSLNSVVLVYQEGDGVAYARGSVQLTRSGERVRMTISDVHTMIVGDADFEKSDAEIIEIAPAGEGYDYWKPDDPVRLGRMSRTNCGLEMVWRERDDTPPAGCMFLEIRGVGYDMLAGECAYYDEWAANWEELRRTPEGELTPSACLITVPASFGE